MRLAENCKELAQRVEYTGADCLISCAVAVDKDGARYGNPLAGLGICTVYNL